MPDESPLPQEPDTTEFEAALARWQEATKDGDHEAAEAASLELMALAAQQAAEGPPDPILELRLAAGEHAAAGRAAEEEAVLLQVLELTGSGENPLQHFRSLQMHADFLSRQGREEEAYQAAVEALECARQGDMPPVLAMALETLIPYHRKANRTREALELAEELVQISASDPLYALQRGRALVQRGRCRLDLGDREAAAADLKEGRSLLMPMSGSLFAAGVQSGLARAAELEADLLAGQGDREGSLWARRDAVHYRRVVHMQAHVSGAGTRLALLDALRKLLSGLEEAGSADEAAGVRAEIEQLESPAPV